MSRRCICLISSWRTSLIAGHITLYAVVIIVCHFRNHVSLPCFYISTHQQHHYPHTGLAEENTAQKVLNIPLPAGSSGAEICACYADEIFPALHSYKPDFVFISAGFDGHKNDPYGAFNLTEKDYHWLSLEIYEIAKKYAEGRVVSILEGGYDLDALKGSYAAHIDAFR